MIRKAFVLFLLAAPLVCAETSFEVIHKKRMRPDGKGRIVITGEAIEFEAHKKKNSRRWAYQDIQYFDRVSPAEFILLSYEDVGRLLGRDKRYRFAIASGELSEEEFRRISAKIGRPVRNRAFPDPASVTYEAPVKHLHRMGGCEGTLLFSDKAIYYKSGNDKHSREWLLGRDVNSVWSADSLQLEIHAYEDGRRAFSKTRVYKFELKKPLDAEFYRRLKLRLYSVETAQAAVSERRQTNP